MRYSVVKMRCAFLFAGQGSQYTGMGKDLYDSFPEARLVFDQADRVLGFSLSELCFAGEQEKLKPTIISQPAILTVSIAAYEAFKAKNKLEPVFMAGLSLGEYSALIAAGSMNFADGLKLVRKRAEIMEEAARKNPGKMIAVIDLAVDKIKEICREAGVEIANLNAPGQTVISGRPEGIEKAIKLCTEAGVKRVIPLEVSGAFHSSAMSGASEELKKVLDGLTMADCRVKVVSNYTAAPEVSPRQIKENLVFQIYRSVRWEESMRYILAEKIDRFFEFGPGRVLKGLMRRIDAAAGVVSIEKKEDILSSQGKEEL